MKKRIVAFDYIRVLAMFCIIVFHWNGFLQLVKVQTQSIFVMEFKSGNIAHIGVSLFFILSGASLMISNSNKLEIKSYLLKRFLSIYPLYWITYIAIYISFYYIKNVPLPAPKKSLILSFLGMDGFLNYRCDAIYLIGEWFVGCIVIIYLLFPILYKCVNKYPVKTAIVTAVLFVLWVCFYPFEMEINRFPLTRLPEVMFGMYYVKYIHNFMVKNELRNTYLRIIGVISLIMFSIPLCVKINIPVPYLNIWLGVSCFLTLVWIVTMLENRLASVTPYISQIAKYSYALFLLHHIVMSDFIGYHSGLPMSMKRNYLIFFYYLIFIGIIGVALSKISTLFVKLSSKILGRCYEKVCYYRSK